MSDTPRTDEARRQYQATLWQGRDATTIETVDIEFTRELERELDELRARHKTAILECSQYTPESWAAACEHEEPCAVWIDGAQMTRLMKASEDCEYYKSSLRKVEDRELNLMKDKERLDWLLNNHMVKGEWETFEDDDRIQYQVIYPDREAIDKAISSGDR